MYNPSSRRALLNVALIVALVALGCGGEASKHYPPGTVLPADPVLGPDADADGLRDDIAEYIDAVTVAEPLERDALRQYARATRRMLAVPLERAAAVAAKTECFRALECLLFIQERAGARDRLAAEEVSARTLDTSDRSRAYLARERLVGGMHYALEPRASSHLACDFDTSRLGGAP